MDSPPCYATVPSIHATHLGSQRPASRYSSVLSCLPLPVIEPPAQPDVSAAAGLHAISVDLPDLFFGTRPVKASGKPLEVDDGLWGRGGPVFQHGVFQKQADSEDVDSHSTCALPPNSTLSSPEDQPLQRKGKNRRICKAKRDRYRRLVEQLVERARRDPSMLDLDSASWPAFRNHSPESQARLRATVMKFAQA